MYVHPHLSTVTYLTDNVVSAPTLVLECRVDPHTGAVDEQRSFKAGYASWPRKGKHLKFDGSLLHAAPIDLMPTNSNKFDEYSTHGRSFSRSHQKEEERRCRRITFLVNIWLNYKPVNVKPFPETMLDKLSKHHHQTGNFQLFVNNDRSSGAGNSEEHLIPDDDHDDNDEHQKRATRNFKWPMGNSDDENICVDLPINDIHEKQLNGFGSLRFDIDESQLFVIQIGSQKINITI